MRDCEFWGNTIIQASDTICTVFGNIGVDWNKRGDDGRVRKYNACFIAYQGRLWGNDNYPYPFRIKTLLPNYREFEDTRHFYCTRKLAVELDMPIGDLLQPVRVLFSNEKTLTLGCILCEDGWSDDYSVHPSELLAAKGQLDMLINISSSPFTLGKNNKRHRVFSQQARNIAAPLVYVNNVGLQNNSKTVYTFDGCSTIYSAAGDIIAAAPTFCPELKVVNLTAEVDVRIEISDDTGVDTIYQALQYGISRFLDSIGMKRVVIGLSGGIDSAVSAALLSTVLPPENLLLVNMPSQYNSQTQSPSPINWPLSLARGMELFPLSNQLSLPAARLQNLECHNATGHRLELN